MIEHLLLSQSIEKSEECAVWFHCPACGFRNVEGVAWSERHNTWILHAIPVMKQTFHWAKGSCCKQQLISQVEPRELAAIDIDEIQAKRLLIERHSAVSIVFLIGAALLFIAPVIGPIFLGFAWFLGGFVAAVVSGGLPRCAVLASIGDECARSRIDDCRKEVMEQPIARLRVS
jgi:hypothetical protein